MWTTLDVSAVYEYTTGSYSALWQVSKKTKELMDRHRAHVHVRSTEELSRSRLPGFLEELWRLSERSSFESLDLVSVRGL